MENYIWLVHNEKHAEPIDFYDTNTVTLDGEIKLGAKITAKDTEYKIYAVEEKDDGTKHYYAK